VADAGLFKKIYRVLTWSSFVGLIIVMILVLRTSPAPVLPTDPAAAERAEKKFEAADQAKAAGQPGQVALDRTELGDGIESLFTGTLTYYDRVETPRGWKFWQPRRRPFETKVVLDWEALPPVQRIELMTNHKLAKREKEKLELLRSLLTYFHYATKETRADVFRSEIERMNRAVEETKDRWRTRQIDAPPTDVSVRWGDAQDELGKHRGERVV